MAANPRAGQPAQPEDLIDVAQVVTAYYTVSPDPDNVSPTGTVNIVVMTRLVWRKGVHLLVQLIPEVSVRVEP